MSDDRPPSHSGAGAELGDTPLEGTPAFDEIDTSDALGKKDTIPTNRTGPLLYPEPDEVDDAILTARPKDTLPMNRRANVTLPDGMIGPAPDHASAYVPPHAAPKPANHKTLEMDLVRVNDRPDPRRAAATQKLPRIEKRPPSNSEPDAAVAAARRNPSSQRARRRSNCSRLLPETRHGWPGVGRHPRLHRGLHDWHRIVPRDERFNVRHLRDLRHLGHATGGDSGDQAHATSRTAQTSSATAQASRHRESDGSSRDRQRQRAPRADDLRDGKRNGPQTLYGQEAQIRIRRKAGVQTFPSFHHPFPR